MTTTSSSEIIAEEKLPLFPLREGDCLPFPLPPDATVEVWEVKQKRRIGLYVSKLTIFVDDPHWDWAGRVYAWQALPFTKVDRLIMPDRFRSNRQAISKEEQKQLKALLEQEFETEEAAGLAHARSGLGVCSNLGISWWQEKEGQAVLCHAPLIKTGNYFSFSSSAGG